MAISSQGAFARALLNLNIQKEENEEYEAWQEYQRKKLEDQSDAGIFGFVGALLGATIGIFVGGPAGAMKGWGWGKQIGGFGHQAGWWGDEFDEKEFLKSDIFKGGKFNRQKMQATVEAELAELDVDADVDLINLVTDLAQTYITASVLPGKSDIEGWGEMNAFQKVGATFKSFGQKDLNTIMAKVDNSSNLVNKYISTDFGAFETPQYNFNTYISNRGMPSAATSPINKSSSYLGSQYPTDFEWE